MNKFWIMLTQTYMNRIKSKSFVITTLVSIVLIFGLSNIQSIIESFNNDKTKEVAVLSDNEEWTAALQQSLKNNGKITSTAYSGTLDEAKKEVEDENFAAAVEISESDQGLPQASFYSNQIASTEVSEPVKQALQQVKVNMVTKQADIDPAVLQQISAPVTFDLVALEKSAKTAEELTQTRGLVYIMLFVMYFSVLMYGNMISTEVATEKSSRVMEILISSVSPVSQMFAKIFGIALLGLTQFCIFILAGFLGIKQGVNSGNQSFLDTVGVTNADPVTIVYAVLFFVLGYLLYATLAAMLGSLVSRLEDAQQIVAPMMMLVVASFILAVFGLNMPDAAFITATSYFPFFTPLIMFLRVGMLDIPLWEVLLSISIMVASIILLGIIGARVYRGGVLLYGKSSSLKDFKRAMQLSKKEN
ncbi:ABC transporter permease [Halobacillus salinarum]|uniref:ABC transporter permease n=1 Tax=Halobacillus salinarum TaxID=2932257 RepID=A0ABY4EGC2_9BACI|nr:ABC transporter permease [Halobacillus salinarum]UOQ43521.1 ABC transporter permease [Halobacillus salinarum]